MTAEEYRKWEQEAIKRGYKKFTATSSTNEYSYFKTIGREIERYKYMVEWRVWDWHKYIDRDAHLEHSPYSLEVNIMPDSINACMRLDMLIGDPLVLGFDKVEETAENYYQFLQTQGLVK